MTCTKEVIVFSGPSNLKSNLLAQCSIILAKTNANVLAIDFDTVYPSLDLIFNVDRKPLSIDYSLSDNTYSSLNYIADAIDKGKLNSYIFSEMVLKYRNYQNLNILTGNNSLYACQYTLNQNHYQQILDTAKTIYDYISIDTSSNVFLDVTQFSMLCATKLIFAIEQNMLSIRNAKSMLSLYIDKWGIDKEKVSVVLIEGQKNNIDIHTVRELFNEYEICSVISEKMNNREISKIFDTINIK